MDDEPDLLKIFEDTFTALSAGNWTVHCAATPNNALELIKQRKMDLVVVDVNMPLLDGIQFLGLLGKRYPDLKKVTLTGLVSEEKRSACLAAGAELFIEKPGSFEGFKSVYAMLDDLMSWAPQQGFQGVLRRVGLQDVIQMECLGRNSSVLEVYNEQVLGRIYIEDGSIIHAACGDQTGEPALQRLLALAGGSFELVPFEPPPRRTLEGPWEFLLMEAARVRDEMASQAPPEPPKAAPTAPALPETLRVTETLICSGTGETLYQVNCQDQPGRVQLMQAAAHEGAQLAQLVPLGNFDRLELQHADGRVIAQVKPDRMVFVAVASTKTHGQ